MSNFYDDAIQKLDEGVKAKHKSREAEAMKKAVADKLKEFCKQDDEFAQAVVQGGKFTDCMDAVKKKVKGNSISDIDAYNTAADFYFPGATIRMKMEIDLCGSVDGEEVEPETKILDLSDFL
ncbi:MAG: hypothetical protein KBS74_06750 [Clostridiales bacterium]|nr:hypothetical protein [Candidatus Cacconaster stercorequi]